MAELKPGIKGICKDVVTDGNTALEVGSGGLPVYATPRMLAMMEGAAWSSVEPYMEEGCSTVGTHLDVKHISASPVGAEIRAESELTEVDGRRLTFIVRAYDNAGLIGEGTHERFIIKSGKFMARTAAKLDLPEGEEQ